jgi:hypothetical protein
VKGELGTEIPSSALVDVRPTASGISISGLPAPRRSSSSCSNPPADGDAVRVKHYSQGIFYTIECPEGTRVIRCSDRPDDGEAILHDQLVVPLNGTDFLIPADPPELLPMLAESGNFGVSLVGEPEPDVRLLNVSCLKCGETDVNWLQLWDGSEPVHCDYLTVTDFGGVDIGIHPATRRSKDSGANTRGSGAG